MPGEEWPWKYQVAAVALGLGVPEVILAAAYHGRQRGERGDVPAQVAAIGRMLAVGLDHHGHRVPAHIRANALFKHEVAGVRGFEARRNGVHISGVGRKGNIGARAACQVDQPFEQMMRAFRTFAIEHRFERFEPFLFFEECIVDLDGRGLCVCKGGHAWVSCFSCSVSGCVRTDLPAAWRRCPHSR